MQEEERAMRAQIIKPFTELGPEVGSSLVLCHMCDGNLILCLVQVVNVHAALWLQLITAQNLKVFFIFCCATQ